MKQLERKKAGDICSINKQILLVTCIMKNIFSQIHSKLLSIHENQPEGHAYKRIKLLSGLVMGMISKGNSSLPDIGSGLPQDIYANSKTDAAKRFLSNKWTDYETHFLPFLLPFLRSIIFLIPFHQGIRLVIDGSDVGKHNATLMVSIVWKNRGIPICWYVKKGNKGHFKEQDHVAILQQAHQVLAPLLPQGIAVTVLGDGEFDGIGIQKFCNQSNWAYVLRTACNTVLYENNQEFRARDVQAISSQGVFFIPQVEFTKKRFKYVNFICWHDTKKHEEPIFLVSNLEEVGDIIDYYDQRYSIECLFKDLKSSSFNLHKTRLQSTYDVTNLIIIAALAFITLVALALHNDTQEMRKKVQRVRPDRKVLSFFTFAYKLVDYLIKYDRPLHFSFQFSKNDLRFYHDSTS